MAPKPRTRGESRRKKKAVESTAGDESDGMETIDPDAEPEYPVPPFTGDFDTWEAAEKAVIEYGTRTHQVIVYRSTETVDLKNSRLKETKRYRSGNYCTHHESLM